MFRKQGIDISSRESFELPARLRIIVRVLSRNCALPPPPSPPPILATLSSSCSLPPGGLLPPLDDAIALRIVCFSTPSPPWPSRFPGPDCWSIYPAGPSRFISSVALEMQPKGCVLQADFLLPPSLPLRAFHAVALAVNPSGFPAAPLVAL